MKIGILLGWLSKICYAKKFRGWDSSSGWKVPATRFRWLALLALMCLMPWQGAKAYWSWDEGQAKDKYKSTVKWDKENGVIKYHIRVWQDWGSGLGNGHCYMDGVTIVQKGVSERKVTITVNDKSDWDATTLSVDGHSKGPYSSCGGPDNGDNTYFWDFDLPVDQGDLDGTVSIRMNGVWHGNGWTNQDKISESTTLSINYPHATLKIVKAGYSCSSPENDPLIYFDWENTATENLAKNGTVYLCDDGDEGLERTVYLGETYKTATSGKFRINAGLTDMSGNNPIHNLNDSHSYKIRHVYTPDGNKSIHYISESNAVIVNAYPQVNYVSYDVDSKNSKIKATWRVEKAPSSNCHKGDFVVILERLGKNESILRRDTANVSYKAGQTEYVAPFDLDLGVDTLSYRIRVRRVNPEGESSSCYSSRFEKQIVTQMLSTDHFYVSGTPFAELNDDSTNIILRWNRRGSQWSEGTKFSVKRRELGKDKEDEFFLTEDDFNNQYFVDELATRCKAYEYQLVLKPGNSSYEEQKVQVQVSGKSGNMIYIPYIGSVDGLESSKGHYSDKVKLSWVVTSGLDKVVIERRECDNDNSPFMFVNSVEVSNSTKYFYDDKSCQPGILYEYRIFGVVNCGTDTISTDTLRNYGFRIPSGNFYGRITYENGQAVNSVRVGLETDDDLSTSALEFEGDGEAVIPGRGIMEDATSVTMQAWVYPSAPSTDKVILISKNGYYELGLDNDTIYFIAGNAGLKLTEKLSTDKYTHITAVCDAKNNQLRIYLNGQLSSKTDSVSIFFSSANVGSDVVLGRKFNGQMDEIRLWSRALDSTEIADDYTRYLLGNEKGLDAYYTFDFMVASREENGITTKPGQIYDCSYDGIENFHENSGELYKVKRADSKLTSNQLAYSGVTDSSGVYNIRSVPYYGNGTAYKLIPKKGIHQFSPSQEVRFVGDGTLSHTVNFTDNSSFLVHGVVYYSGGDYPVEGVHFMIDGVPALDKTGQYVMTGANGVYSINVPVGIHEVKAVKEGHTFELDGRICDINGNDLNYQDIVSADLYDNTKVKYIGRVCGGTIQEAYPVGFSFSKNNLADDMKVVLSPTKTNCSLQKVENVHSDTIKHPVFPSQSAKGIKQAAATVCDYNEKDITIHVDNETGEFIAWVYPIEYNVKLDVYGHQDIMGDNSSLNLSSYAINQYETYKYKDSVFNEQRVFERLVDRTDSLDYRQKQVFTKRYRAKMEVKQLEGENELSYFGKQKVDLQSLTGSSNEKTVIPLYNVSSKTYTFGLPVFVTNDNVYMHYTIFEEYPYYVDSKMNTDESKKDRVYIEDASVSFNNKMAVQ